MLKRILSGIIGFLLLIALLFIPNVYVFNIALFIVMVIGLNEFLVAMKVESVSVRVVSFLIMIPQLIYYDSPFIDSLAIYLLLLATFALVIIKDKVENVNYVYFSLLGVLMLGFLSAHILKVREMHFGNLLVWLIFIGAWATDTFAYFVGKAFGKHKFTSISPNKTIEGSLGGLLGTTALMTVYGIIITRYFGVPYGIYNYAVLGFICGIVSQLGDLSASLLKRTSGVKDFGSIMPGHGGILDRFDSILFVAPAVFYYLHFFVRLI